MTSRFFQNGELKDAKIVDALRQAATQYENGEIVEVYDTLIDIVSAIDDYDKHTEARNG